MNPHFVERKVCPVCGSSRLRELYRASYTELPIISVVEARFGASQGFTPSTLEGAEYILRECSFCALIFQVQIPGPELMELMYERWIDPERALHRRQRQVAFRGRIALELMAIADFFDRPPEEMRVLDFGMGWGYWSRIAQGFGFQVLGFELAQSRVEHAERVGITAISRDDLWGQRFDFINTEQVFEHLPDPDEAIAELAGLLSDDGVLKISVPNGMRVKRRLRNPDWTAGDRQGGLGPVAPLQHINCFTHRPLLRLGQTVSLQRVQRPGRLLYRYAPIWERFGNLSKRTVGQHIRLLRHQETNVWFRRARDSRSPQRA